MTLTLRTPAKINLGLWITGKRPDGFHELETLFQMVSLYDTLHFEDIDDGRIQMTCSRADLPAGEDNLMVRAARLLRETAGRPDLGCRMHLDKVIPFGAGLGGGSGNAAGTLLALNRLWDLRQDRGALMELGARLGSDVSFFLCAPAAIGRGRGERLTPLPPCRKFWVLLLSPNCFIATAEVYKRLNLKLTSRQNHISILTDFFSQSDIAGLGAHLHNDLEPIVLEGFKEVREAWSHLQALHAQGVLVSGSGSVVFGVFSDFNQAQRAHAQCQTGVWDSFLTETVSSFSEFLPESLLTYPEG